MVSGGGGGVSGAMLRAAGGPSGNTQFTSLCEQNSGIDVRSVELSTAAALPDASRTSTATQVRRKIRVLPMIS